MAATGAARPLSATVTFDQGTLTNPFGVHIAVVEVDADTGRVEVLRYVAGDDCGSVVHPAIVDGQVHGGVARGSVRPCARASSTQPTARR